MKKLFTILTIVTTVFTLNASNLYKSPADIALRAPSVPLITSDPYLSIWTPYDQLTEGNPQHWTGTEHPIVGALRVDGTLYRFMGISKEYVKPVIPMSTGGAWEAQYTFDKPNGNWTTLGYDDSNWKSGQGAFGTREMPRVKTRWETKDIWVRRTFTLDEATLKEPLVIKYSHDDIFELYLNGEKLVETDYSWNNDVVVELSKNALKKLKKGENVIAAHCHNQAGGAYVDFGLYIKNNNTDNFERPATQKSVDVLPTQTYYTFECGPVELDLVFTAPLLPNDLDLISTPINYISYNVRPLDNKEHDVQVYFETTPELAVNDISQPIDCERIEKNGMIFLKAGTVDQPITKRVGDGVRIDWGHVYLASDKANDKNLQLGEYHAMKNAFARTGDISQPALTSAVSENMWKEMTVLAYTDNLGKVGQNGKAGYVMLGYDDIYSVEYFYERRPAYWKHNGTIDIFTAFKNAAANYNGIMRKCRRFDHELMTDATNAGGKEYAEICALVYRQVFAAHKLVTDNNGNLLFLSKENHSNGCINTVDITYPSSPLYLIYNTELLKGMMTPIFYYSESGRWKKPYPAHDLGTYPIANGQLYGGDMPVEESGNMILLATAISKVEGDPSYALKHWETLTTWTNYLVEKGLDPENQLCTDDFAGHSAHNTNLSVKAIMAIAGYGMMADMAGMPDVAAEYSSIAKEMAGKWMEMADDGDHYRLTFDQANTWSQKYNMVWDNLLDLNVFPQYVKDREAAWYIKKQAEHEYGLPLDSRKNYTKTDWVLWSACLNGDNDAFRQIMLPVYKYANETPSRVAISDWHDTDNAKMMNFKARSVVGGYYMKLLEYKLKSNQ